MQTLGGGPRPSLLDQINTLFGTDLFQGYKDEPKPREKVEAKGPDASPGMAPIMFRERQISLADASKTASFELPRSAAEAWQLAKAEMQSAIASEPVADAEAKLSHPTGPGAALPSPGKIEEGGQPGGVAAARQQQAGKEGGVEEGGETSSQDFAGAIKGYAQMFLPAFGIVSSSSRSGVGGSKPWRSDRRGEMLF